MILVTDIIPPVGTTPDDWADYSWFVVWDQPIRALCDLEHEGEVILVDQNTGLATWRTVVTGIVAFPFEHVDSAVEELGRRWGRDMSYGGPTIAPGVLIGWKATPVGYIGTAVPDVDEIELTTCANCATDDQRRWLDELALDRGRWN